MKMQKLPLKTAVIGCGSMVRRSTLPILSGNESYEVVLLCDTRKEAVEACASEYCIKDVTLIPEEVFTHSDIDVVFLGVRGEYNADFIEMAVAHNKAIFVEKPLGATLQDLQRIASACSESSIQVGVDFNRRYAPSLVAVKERFTRFRSGAAQVSYRMVDDHRIRPHYIFDVSDGKSGHILHEGCHIFDLLAWLLEEDPVTVYAVGPLETDNTVVITFSGGSSASLICGGKGSLFYPKESLEIFCNSHTLALDHFTEMRCTGDSLTEIQTFPHRAEHLPYPDMSAFYRDTFACQPHGEMTNDLILSAFHQSVNKGHSEIIAHFADCIQKGETFQPGVRAGMQATLCSLAAMESLRTGLPVSVSAPVFLKQPH